MNHNDSATEKKNKKKTQDADALCSSSPSLRATRFYVWTLNSTQQKIK